jgi:TldD protein
MNAMSPMPSLLDAAGVDTDQALRHLGEAMTGADDGELFLERSESEFLMFDDGRLKQATYDSGEGFGLRGQRRRHRPGG